MISPTVRLQASQNLPRTHHPGHDSRPKLCDGAEVEYGEKTGRPFLALPRIGSMTGAPGSELSFGGDGGH